MRYSVMFDEVADCWAVVDNNAAGMTIDFHQSEEAAAQEAAAWNGGGVERVAAE